jgi:hypothetical protein
MAIEERIQKVLNEGSMREKNPNFQNLKEFYENMKKAGLVIKQEYNLPPVDTIGRSFYEQSPSKEQTEDAPAESGHLIGNWAQPRF